ncbi:MAG: O-antigen ligase family protein [Flavobacteriales bacterium]|nr:O-antigen ligase family protein [Flavobacteriales bacterium]MBP9080968.1 O-antigen ligase family protein [Flavobacteriales bacterium]
MVRALKSHWIAAVCVLFVVLNALFIAHDLYWLNLLPLALLVGWALVAATDKLLLFIVFATPLSVNLEQLDLGGIGIAVPTEPLMVALMLLFVLKLALEGGVVEPRVWRHPVTVAILLQLGWMALCVLPSSMPMVSLKYLTARLWFVCTMYFMATRIFSERRNMHRFFWSFTAGLALVVAYTLAQHARYGFAEDPAHWVMSPFFKDHTSYGAIIAFFIPFTLMAVGLRSYSRTRRGLALLAFVLLLAGLVFSYTRAAWLGVAGAAAVFAVMRLRVPAWALAVVAAVAGGMLWANMEQITIALGRNQAESHDDLAQHVSSISNIRSDASNLERINRWNSALHMFGEKPVTGWGPGTYMFQYAPFQAARDRTIISTNFGLVGNAHSEYLGPLAEQGLPGLLLVLLVVGTIAWTAVRLWSKLPHGEDRSLVGAAFLGLVTYFVHGLLNNYLDLDKASVPFWGFAAMIVMLDLKYRDRPDQRNLHVSSAKSSK